MKKWLLDNKPTTNKINKIKQISSYQVSENVDWIKNKKQVDENIKNNSFVLVDARSRQRFEGKVNEPRPELRRGSVPGSKNIPFQDCINSKTNTFKTKSELIKIFNENNIDRFKPIVFSCGSGVTACVLSMVYSLISDKNAMIYDGSWSEYGKK